MTLKTTHIVAGVVVCQDGKFLLVQENRPGTPVHQTWNLPAGKVDEGETIEQAAVRETKEEAGYDVELLRKLDIFQDNANTPPKHAFEAKIISAEIRPMEGEVLGVGWFTKDEIIAMQDKLRDPWVLGAISLI